MDLTNEELNERVELSSGIIEGAKNLVHYIYKTVPVEALKGDTDYETEKEFYHRLLEVYMASMKFQKICATAAQDFAKDRPDLFG